MRVPGRSTPSTLPISLRSSTAPAVQSKLAALKEKPTLFLYVELKVRGQGLCMQLHLGIRVEVLEMLGSIVSAAVAEVQLEQRHS